MSLAQQILGALEAASSPVQDIRQRGEAQLEQLRAHPEAYFSACAEILVSPEANLFGRQLVGYQLKNSLSHPACAKNPTFQTAVCAQGVVDPQRSIRKVACGIISLAVRELLWPLEPVVQSLTAILSQRSGELCAVHGAIRALSQIVDDCLHLLDMRQMTGHVVQAVLPFLTSDHLGDCADAQEVLCRALEIVSMVLEQAGMDTGSLSHQCMQGCVLQVIEACFMRLQRPFSNSISAKCANCISLSLGFYPLISDDLFTRMQQLMYVAITTDTGAEEELRIVATEFFGSVLYFPHFAELSETTLQNIIPVLIKSMVFSDMEMGMLQAKAEDWNVPDRIDDIRPRHYRARVHVTNDDDEDDDDDEVAEWNLRRISARTLDSISEFFGERILLSVLSVIDGMMQPQRHWKELEAAILAFGAICDGCFNYLTPYLPDISNRLLGLLDDPNTHFLVTTITLWSCTQIGRYIVSDATQLQRLLKNILAKMQSHSKVVQEAASSALERIVALCDEGQLDNSSSEIFTCIAQCIPGYQLKNRVVLFEVLSSVCDNLGDALRADLATVQVLLDPLGAIWSSTPNNSPLLFPFFCCMSRVCSTLGSAMQSMGNAIFERAYGILSEHMQERFAALQQNGEPPELDFLITSADLLSGLFDALGSSLEPLVAQRQPQFMQVLLAMLMDESPQVRQSGFSLSGDLAKACPTYLQSVFTPFYDAALQNTTELTENNYAVISNVAWTLCNVLENQMDINDLPTLQNSPVMAQLFASLGRILGTADITADMRNMADNIALCLGSMLYIDVDVEQRSGCSVAVFARRFCEYMRCIREVPHKETAVNGFLLAVDRQSQVVLENLTLFFDFACAIATEGPETKRAMQRVLERAKGIAPQLWQQRLSEYNEQLRHKLYHTYGLD